MISTVLRVIRKFLPRRYFLFEQYGMYRVIDRRNGMSIVTSMKYEYAKSRLDMLNGDA